MFNSCISPQAVLGAGVQIGRFCIIEEGAVLGDGVVVEDYAMVLSGARIGARTKIGTYTKVGCDVRIGEDCSFTSFCEIRDKCQLGDRVLMGSRGTLSAGTVVEDDVVMKYGFVVTDTPDLTRNNEKVVGRLKRKSRFGANVVIMPAVTIGENVEIGACSQVRRDVPDNEVWFGIPAKYYRDAAAASPAEALAAAPAMAVKAQAPLTLRGAVAQAVAQIETEARATVTAGLDKPRPALVRGLLTKPRPWPAVESVGPVVPHPGLARRTGNLAR